MDDEMFLSRRPNPNIITSKEDDEDEFTLLDIAGNHYTSADPDIHRDNSNVSPSDSMSVDSGSVYTTSSSRDDEMESIEVVTASGKPVEGYLEPPHRCTWADVGISNTTPFLKSRPSMLQSRLVKLVPNHHVVVINAKKDRNDLNSIIVSIMKPEPRNVIILTNDEEQELIYFECLRNFQDNLKVLRDFDNRPPNIIVCTPRSINEAHKKNQVQFTSYSHAVVLNIQVWMDCDENLRTLFNPKGNSIYFTFFVENRLEACILKLANSTVTVICPPIPIQYQEVIPVVSPKGPFEPVTDEDRLPFLMEILHSAPQDTAIFCSNRSQAKWIYDTLSLDDKSISIHGPSSPPTLPNNSIIVTWVVEDAQTNPAQIYTWRKCKFKLLIFYESKKYYNKFFQMTDHRGRCILLAWPKEEVVNSVRSNMEINPIAIIPDWLKNGQYEEQCKLVFNNRFSRSQVISSKPPPSSPPPPPIIEKQINLENGNPPKGMSTENVITTQSNGGHPEDHVTVTPLTAPIHTKIQTPSNQRPPNTSTNSLPSASSVFLKELDDWFDSISAYSTKVSHKEKTDTTTNSQESKTIGPYVGSVKSEDYILTKYDGSEPLSDSNAHPSFALPTKLETPSPTKLSNLLTREPQTQAKESTTNTTQNTFATGYPSHLSPNALPSPQFHLSPNAYGCPPYNPYVGTNSSPPSFHYYSPSYESNPPTLGISSLIPTFTPNYVPSQSIQQNLSTNPTHSKITQETQTDPLSIKVSVDCSTQENSLVPYTEANPVRMTFDTIPQNNVSLTTKEEKRWKNVSSRFGPSGREILYKRRVILQ